jgi:hypothetical protein
MNFGLLRVVSKPYIHQIKPTISSFHHLPIRRFSATPSRRAWTNTELPTGADLTIAKLDALIEFSEEPGIKRSWLEEALKDVMKEIGEDIESEKAKEIGDKLGVLSERLQEENKTN